METDFQIIRNKFRQEFSKCDFYIGSKKVNIKSISHLQFDIEKNDSYYNIYGNANFELIQENGDTFQNGCQKFQTIIEVENENIISIGRVDISY